MVKLIPIDPKDIPTAREGRRGRVSYPLLKMFLEANTKVSKLDLTGSGKNPNYLRSVLTAYINTHHLPIKLFSSGGELYLMRLDLDNDNNPVEWSPEENATEGAGGLLRGVASQPITPEEVQKRFNKEKGQTTK